MIQPISEIQLWSKAFTIRCHSCHFSRSAVRSTTPNLIFHFGPPGIFRRYFVVLTRKLLHALVNFDNHVVSGHNIAREGSLNEGRSKYRARTVTGLGGLSNNDKPPHGFEVLDYWEIFKATPSGKALSPVLTAVPSLSSSHEETFSAETATLSPVCNLSA